MHISRPVVAQIISGILLAQSSFAQDWVQQRLSMPKVRDRVAAVPRLDDRLAQLQKALDGAKDQTSLSATTARYILEFTKEIKATPEAFDFRMQLATGAGPRPARPETPPRKYAELIGSLGLTADIGDDLTRAEKLAVDVRAGRDPLAGVKGDVRLAYRSDLDGVLMPYRIFVPTRYNKSQKYPMIVLLHGGGMDENTFLLGSTLQDIAAERGYILASINGRGPISSYLKSNGAEKDLFDVMALMEKYYNIDRNHIFLTGHSMGGLGTWIIGLEYRDRFAALAPMAGTRQAADLDARLASGKRIPILITVGGKDTAVPPQPGIDAYRKLKELGYPTKIVEYPEDEHGAVYLSSVPEVFAWFDQYRK
jgi:acetyl esterase/lipase